MLIQAMVGGLAFHCDDALWDACLGNATTASRFGSDWRHEQAEDEK
jgi:hypothetical protein